MPMEDYGVSVSKVHRWLLVMFVFTHIVESEVESDEIGHVPT